VLLSVNEGIAIIGMHTNLYTRPQPSLTSTLEVVVVDAQTKNFQQQLHAQHPHSRRRSASYNPIYFFRNYSPRQSRAELVMMKLIVCVDFIKQTKTRHSRNKSIHSTTVTFNNIKRHLQQHERSLTTT